MASRKLIRRDKVRCACGRCRTYAVISRYACGCIGVDIHHDQRACSACSDFSGMRHSCRRC